MLCDAVPLVQAESTGTPGQDSGRVMVTGARSAACAQNPACLGCALTLTALCKYIRWARVWNQHLGTAQLCSQGHTATRSAWLYPPHLDALTREPWAPPPCLPSALLVCCPLWLDPPWTPPGSSGDRHQLPVGHRASPELAPRMLMRQQRQCQAQRPAGDSTFWDLCGSQKTRVAAM